MVSKWCTRRTFSRTRHQWNIYGESNRRRFFQIFCDLTASQIPAIYRPLLSRSKIARSIATGTKGLRGREMFFLLRMAFWLGLVLVLLPRERTPESDKLPQVGASEAVSAATAAVSDMSQFCKRQPAACEVGGQAATVIGQRAQDGARKLYKIITKPDHPSVPDKKPDHTSSIGDGAEAVVVNAPTADALTEED